MKKTEYFWLLLCALQFHRFKFLLPFGVLGYTIADSVLWWEGRTILTHFLKLLNDECLIFFCGKRSCSIELCLLFQQKKLERFWLLLLMLDRVEVLLGSGEFEVSCIAWHLGFKENFGLCTTFLDSLIHSFWTTLSWEFKGI